MWHLPWPVIEQDQWTRVPCIAKQILNHWTTREAPLLNPLMNCQIVFNSSCTILHYLQQCTLFSFSPYLCQHLFSGLSAYNSHPSGGNKDEDGTSSLLFASPLWCCISYVLTGHLSSLKKTDSNEFKDADIDLKSFFNDRCLLRWVKAELHTLCFLFLFLVLS